MRKRLLAGLGVLVLTAASVEAQTLNIDHQPVGCAVAERFPRLEARFAPGDAVATARVLFQSENTKHWYAVAMKSDGPAFSGVLPKPKKSLKAFQYYIEVADKSLGTNRTANYTTSVVATSAECQGKVVAGSLGSASVLLQAPEGAATLPAGFSSTGVVAAGSGAAAAAAAGAGAGAVATGGGAAAAGTAAAAGGGGGLSTGALVGIVAGAGAVAAGVAVAATRGGTTYEGAFNTEMVMTYFGCSHVHALSGTVRIALEESGGSAAGPMEISKDRDTVVSSNCTGADTGPGIGNSFGCSVSGTPGNLACSDLRTFTFQQTTSQQTTAFAGGLSGGVIAGMLTLALTGRIGNSDETFSASTTFPISLR